MHAVHFKTSDNGMICKELDEALFIDDTQFQLEDRKM